MGIKFLNKYLNTNCKKHIYELHLSELKNKKIVIDTSIYLYRFKKDNMLIEGFYQMISLFRYYEIIPIFIFDGKPPIEKERILKERIKEKISHLEEYKKINNKIELLNNKIDLLNNTNDNELYSLKKQLLELKKNCIRITYEDINNVRELLYISGIHYKFAKGEADQLCAYLVLNNYAYGCLSEDMDLFVYGCPNIFRYLSLLKETVIYYNFKEILKVLNLSIDEFQQICILTGTDYNDTLCMIKDNEEKKINIYKSIELFIQYKNEINNIPKISNNIYNNINIEKDNITFYEWLNDNDIISDDEIINFNKTIEMFNKNKLEEYINKDNIKDILYTLKTKVIHSDLLQSFLKDYGYIFLDDILDEKNNKNNKI